MIRTLAMAAGLAITATAAQGSFTGMRMLHNAADDAAASAAIGQNAVVLRLYAAFDGMGDVNATPGTPAADAALLNVALSSSFGNITVTNGTFHQEVQGFGNTTPGVPTDPAKIWDTFGTVGALNIGVPGASSLALEPGTDETTTNWHGGVFNADPPNGLGNAVSLSSGDFGVLLFQFVIVGSTPGPNGFETFGAKGPLGTDAQGAPLDSTTLFNDYLTGVVTTFSKNPGVPIRHDVIFSKGTIPTPGTLALFGIAGLAATRRRR